MAAVRGLLRPVRHVWRAVADAAWPQTCAACGAGVPGATGELCTACAAALGAILRAPYCGRCGRTLPAPAIHERNCAHCRREVFWNVAGVARVGRYGPADRSLVLRLKYGGDERNARLLARLLRAAVEQRGWRDELEVLVPVPMHWLRRLQRPCNHALLLARELGRELRLPIVQLVRRARAGPSQTAMTTKHARFENVRGCFVPRRSRAAALLGPERVERLLRRAPAALAGRVPRVAGKTVCIVDNLLVAGATVTEIAKVLRGAGARRIYAAVVSRPPAPGDPPSSMDAVGQPPWASHPTP